MSSFSARAAAIWELPHRPPPPQVDLAILGDGIKSLSPVRWEPHMLFSGARDRELREITGLFPLTARSRKSTHPLFVLETIQNLAHRVCPCSSKDWGSRRVIRKGCPLQYTGRVTDRDSFPVESCSFNLPMDPAFTRNLRFLGLVPDDCIETRGP